MKIGIDIGGSHIGIGLVNEEGNIIYKKEIDANMSNKGELDVIDFIADTILEMNKSSSIEMIGIGAPGNPEELKITNLVNFGVKEIDFKLLQNKLPNIPIRIMNDAKVAALAEKRYGALREAQDGVYICIGTGVGGAVFYNNELIQPKRAPGFELGHMIIRKDGNNCTCGKNGCFESYCSIKKFKENVKSKLKELKVFSIEEPQMLLQELARYKEEKIIKREIEEYIENLIVGVSNIIDIFEPEVICIGGSFVYYKDIIFNEVVKRITQRKYVFNKGQLPKLVLAQLKNDAGIIGATLIP